MNEFNRLNEIVETTNTTDFRIHSYDGVNLIITGSFDFCYYHEVEVEFSEVYYISLPSDFSNPKFRLASAEEVKEISKIIALENEATVYCVEAETSSSIALLPFFVVAESVSLREGTVYYEPKAEK